jgi:hypothetical protein
MNYEIMSLTVIMVMMLIVYSILFSALTFQYFIQASLYKIQ